MIGAQSKDGNRLRQMYAGYHHLTDIASPFFALKKTAERIKPNVSLIVSGDTDVVVRRGLTKYQLIGTQGRCCGEAFDKVAKMMDSVTRRPGN